jgi:hypothetical protein
VPEVKEIGRTMSGLREALFETLDQLRAGKIQPGQASAIVGVANSLLKTVSVQLQFEKLKNEQKAPARLTDMPLVPNATTGGHLRAVGSAEPQP